MYEYAPEERSPDEITSAVKRFRADLLAVGHDYLAAHGALQEWLAADFQMADEYSGRYIADLESKRILPGPELYSTASDMALMMHRQAMYSYWMPLYRVSHESDEFRLWVPAALRAAVPPAGGHDKYCRKSPADITEALGRLACKTALVCPVRFIADEVMLSPPFLPLNSDEYMFFDADKAKVDAHSLIQAVADREFINLSEMRTAAQASRAAYDYIV